MDFVNHCIHENYVDKIGPFPGGHFAKRLCMDCKAFIKWVAKPGPDKERRPKQHLNLAKKFGKGFCEICRRTESELPPGESLCGDHIEGYSDNKDDEPTAETTLITCTFCHMFVHMMRTYLGHYHGRKAGRPIQGESENG